MVDLRSAFDTTVEANREIVSDLDAALIAAGRVLADHIDGGGDGSVYLMPHFMNILREMYATPKIRREAGVGKEGARGRLADVRDLRHRPAPTKKRAASA